MFEDKNYASSELPLIKIYKEKFKTGQVERAKDQYEVICKNMFKKETNLSLFKDLVVTLSTGEKGIIDDSFGQSGKFKVRIPGKAVIKSMQWKICIICFFFRFLVSNDL